MACAPEKGPTFLRVYAIPVLLLNIAFAGWDIVAASTAHDWSIYLGYAVIVTISLRLYLGYWIATYTTPIASRAYALKLRGKVQLHMTDKKAGSRTSIPGFGPKTNSFS